MSLAEIRRRFLVLRALRWLPTGLLIPIVVLLLLERGLIPGQIGLVIACQGLVVMLLELPTGGLGDTLGRRPVLMAAARFDLAGLSLLVVAETVPRPHAGVRLAGRLPGAGERAARVWYVDAAQAVDPDADIEAAMGPVAWSSAWPWRSA